MNELNTEKQIMDKSALLKLQHSGHVGCGSAAQFALTLGTSEGKQNQGSSKWMSMTSDVTNSGWRQTWPDLGTELVWERKRI